MRESRGAAVVTGVFFLVAAVTAVAALALYRPLLGDPGYVLGAGADTQVRWGALLEVVLAASCIGTAVAAYPVVERHGRALALGYVCGRLLEAAVIVVGIVSVLAVVALRSADDDASPLAVARGLVALHDATFLVGPGLVIGVNTLLLAVLVYRGGLAPRWIAGTGLVGGPLVFLSSTAVLFGVYEQVSVWGFLGAVPVTVWEMGLAVYLVARGFRQPASPARPGSALPVPVPA
ncbi:DUF4386 domain-containing protein [Geodermatophilus sp. SYSU D00684]